VDDDGIRRFPFEGPPLEKSFAWRITVNKSFLQPLSRHRLIFMKLGVQKSVPLTPHGVSSFALFRDAGVWVVEYESNFNLRVRGANVKVLLPVYSLKAPLGFHDNLLA